MAIIKGHGFHPKNGFTGSANPGASMAPAIPGFKRGGMEHESAAEERREETGHHTRTKLGKTDARDHFGEHKHVDHDGEMHQSHAAYDEHGFQHLAHGGKSAKHHAKKHEGKE
jgi:hypothetical protein